MDERYSKELSTYLEFGSSNWFREGKKWKSQVDEAIFEAFQIFVTLNDLYKQVAN